LVFSGFFGWKKQNKTKQKTKKTKTKKNAVFFFPAYETKNFKKDLFIIPTCVCLFYLFFLVSIFLRGKEEKRRKEE